MTAANNIFSLTAAANIFTASPMIAKEKLLKIMCSAELSEKLEALPLADLW